ncbi:ATP-binding cassette domain-containing protein [Micromonospora eburnea]|uniref:Putative ATP-binding cassette transporter n=1 Tax=Micromonospora eburnea TaxID=227316 RepID=A0A1C6USC1_9ACTN|nr:ATP-binding cassette domain-containing protein [Micromonospora eburnea]SCL56891.1 putative ATP-binding cassette transporter [Micromonospora eburnea]
MSLFAYLLRYRRGPFLLAIVAGIVSGGTGAAFIAMVNLALDADGAPTARLIWGYVALCLATLLTRFVSQAMLYRLSQGAIYHLRRRLIDGILGAPLRTVEKTGTARLYSALSDDVVVIADALPGLPGICSGAAFVVVAIAYLVIVSPVVALATGGTVVVGVLLYLLMSATGLGALKAARREQDVLFGHFRSVTEGIKELKLNRDRRTALVEQELERTALAYRRHSVVGLSVYEGATGGGQGVFFTFIGLLLFAFPAWFALTGQTLAACVLILLFAVSSLQGVLVWFPALGRASVALATIEERLAALKPVAGEPAGPPPAAGPGDAVRPAGVPAQAPATGTSSAATNRFAGWRTISFRGVSHVYPGPTGEEFVLGPLDFEFRRGEILFVVGANGSGKTTLAKVLTSLYPPEAGVVQVDGTEVTTANREDYRNLFSAVFSDFHLFDSLLGLPADRAERAQHYLRRLQLDHKVRITGDRFSTTALSLGQRKRLALLVAYLEDRSFYLFDEWAADQDPTFKDFFYRELLPELRDRDKAVVVISHDDRYFHAADRLVRLDYGQIREEEMSGGQAVAGRPGVESGS